MNLKTFIFSVVLLVSGSAWCDEVPAYRLQVESNAVARLVILSNVLPGNIVINNGQLVVNGMVWRAGNTRPAPANQSSYPCILLAGQCPRNGELLLARRGNDCIAIVSAALQDSELYVQPVFARRPFRGGERLYPFRLEKVLNSPEDKKAETRQKDLLGQLGHKDFKKREAAGRELTTLLPGSMPVLMEALSSPDPEIKLRAEKIMEKAGGRALLPPDPELMALLGGKPPEDKGAPFLGISMLDYSAGGVKGVMVQQVVPGTVAVKAGIKEGDVILTLDDKPSTTSNELLELIQLRDPGDEVTLELLRNKEKLKVKTVLGTKSVQ